MGSDIETDVADDTVVDDAPMDAVEETTPDPTLDISDVVNPDRHGCWGTYECAADCGDDTDCNLACISSMCEPSRTPYNALSGCRNLNCSAHCMADLLADQCITCQAMNCPEEFAVCRATGCE